VAARIIHPVPAGILPERILSGPARIDFSIRARVEPRDADRSGRTCGRRRNPDPRKRSLRLGA
jgi:hypothetical protein